MKQLRIISLILLMLSLGIGLSAQAGKTSAAAAQQARAVLAYFDDENEIQVFDVDGFAVKQLYPGLVLSAGDRVQTTKSSAEIQLTPNGTIIRLSNNTNFRINNLASAASNTNQFTLISGKFRTVAAKSSGQNYQFNGPTTVGGVRGTDFGMEAVPGEKEKLIVREGSVQFDKADGSGSVLLGAGQGADAFSSTFQALPLSTQDLADFFQGMDFTKLVPDQVPGHTTDAAAPTDGTVNSNANADGGDKKPAAAATPPKPKTDPVMDAIFATIRKIIGLEIGSTTIDGKTYGKIIFQPHLDTPDFRIGLYLPIIYQDDVFDPSTWYHPKSNDEWSFGVPQFNNGDILGGVEDLLSDLALKIKYIGIGKQGDPFYFDVGNLSNMTLGHGFLIGGYANDADFPAVRRLGVSIGLDVGAIALQGLVNDLAAPDIFGFRFLWRPLSPSFKLGIGISAASDINPASSLSVDPTTTSAAVIAANQKVIDAKPGFLNFGVDLDLPILENNVFSLLVFADFGGMVPFLQNAYTPTSGNAVTAGLHFENFLDVTDINNVKFNNWGFEAGIKGKILSFIDYRLQFEDYNGSFKTSFYDTTYDRTRGATAVEVLNQLSSGTTINKQTIGIFGDAGANILNIIQLRVAYNWPWDPTSATLGEDVVDHFIAYLGSVPDALPLGINAYVSFERDHFRDMFTQPDKYAFLDGYAIFKGSVDIPIGDLLKIRATVGTAAKRDSSGAIVEINGVPQVEPTFTLETVF